MGLSRPFLAELIELKKAGALDGLSRVVEIGAHQLTNDFLRATDDIAEIFQLYGRSPGELGEPIGNETLNGAELLHRDAPFSAPFWRGLGFDYAAIEYGGRHGVIALDLNCDTVPPELAGRFDLAVNAGTTEHAANQENAFRVIHDLVSAGGTMIHTVPGGGYMTHGLFCYTLKFFWHLCRENDYRIIKLQIAPFGSGPPHPDVIDSNARWGDRRYPGLPAEIADLGILAVLRKQHAAPFRTPLDCL
jgi:hypothetical protein